MSRKIVQIAMSPNGSDGVRFEPFAILVALCDDGSVWTRAMVVGSKWVREDTSEVEAAIPSLEGTSETIYRAGVPFRQDCQPRPGLEFDPNAGGDL